jgi:hypothetical protein
MQSACDFIDRKLVIASHVHIFAIFQKYHSLFIACHSL